MPTDQRYVGGDPHAKHTEGTVNNRPKPAQNSPLTSDELAEFKDKSNRGLPKSRLSVTIDLNTQTLNRPSYAETVIFALQAYQEQMLKETGEAVAYGVDSIADAHFAFQHAQNASNLLVELSIQLAYQVRENYEATTDQTLYVRNFLQQHDRNELSKAEFAKLWMGATYPQE